MSLPPWGKEGPWKIPARLEAMLRHANLIITARNEGKLIGIARSLTDTTFCTYLVRFSRTSGISKARGGFGKTLILKPTQPTLMAKLILLSAPKAIEFYPKK